jgi:hypothetical protein
MKRGMLVMLGMAMGMVAFGATGCFDDDDPGDVRPPEDPVRPDKPSEPPSPCVKAGDGVFCGETIGWATGSYQRPLITCSGGTAVEVNECKLGCVSNDGAHHCAEEPKADPDRCADKEDGWYCGDELGLMPDTHVMCRDGKQYGYPGPCPIGCRRQYGTAFCGDFHPCSKAPDGQYCGDVMAWPEQNTLVTCSGGEVAGVQKCATGCMREAETYFCGDKSPCAKTTVDGDYCGDEIGWPDPTARVNCRNGAAVTVYKCQTGCIREYGHAYCE